MAFRMLIRRQADGSRATEGSHGGAGLACPSSFQSQKDRDCPISNPQGVPSKIPSHGIKHFALQSACWGSNLDINTSLHHDLGQVTYRCLSPHLLSGVNNSRYLMALLKTPMRNANSA